ncbi:MAG TPA: amino acid adenylation domain-containing protein [Pyrinomonadaceae bacterium]|nr:amino acid adenylation domain-containing protein [Pyrinomonadaceae bacterium]
MNPLNAGIVIFDSKLKEERDYWLGHLSREIKATSFPTDFERPDGYSPERETVELNLSGELYERLQKLTGGSSFLLYVALLTAWKVCLFKHTQHELVVLGSPARRRNESAAPLSLNALAVIDEVREEMTFRQLLLQVRETLLAAYSNQNYPYRRLVADFGLAGVENRCPLFDVAVALSSIHHELPEVRNDITITFTEETDCVRGAFGFNPRLFTRESVERWVGQFLHLLGEALERPNARIAELELLTGPERVQIESEWNQTDVSYRTRACLHQLFEAQAARTPDAIAVISGDEQASYRELNERANRVASRLIGSGVGPESLVGVYMERSVEMVVAILAVHKAGGAYVPLDPGYPAQYLSYMLEDAKVEVLLTQRRFASRLSAYGVPVLSLDSEEFFTAQESLKNPISRAGLDNAAYVIYTSGSTGNPKGAVVTHRGILNRLLWMQQAYRLTEDDRVLQKTPFSFDVSVWEFFWPLMVGARLVMARPEGHKDAAYLLRMIKEQGITTLHFVPSMLHLFLEEEGVEGCASLRRVICSGEALTAELVRRFYQRLQSADLHNLYGPTEASVDVTYWACPREQSSKVVPIGRPIANTRIYILDSNLKSVPVGAAGELHIGGVGLARGYLNRPDLTAERFIPSPFGPEEGERLYRSGDLARFLPDGQIEFLGRIDQQVKVHGFRIELGEIEAVLAEHPAIREAVVEPRANGQGEKRLVAYFVPEKTRTLSAAQSGLYRLPNDMAVAHQNPNETNFLYQEIFEEQSYLKHGITLRKGDCVFDVGANIGLFTLFTQEACEDVRVYAFEPVPPIYDLLHQNVQLHAPGAKIFNCGLSDRARLVPFTYYPRSSIMSGYYADEREEKEVVASFTLNRQQQSLGASEARQLVEDTLEGHFISETFDCQLKTLSDVIDEEQVERIDLLKIDVEKSELDVIGGLRAEHWPKIKQVVIEVHDLDGRLQMLKSLLEEKGFRVEVDQDCWLKGTSVYQLYAVRPSAYVPEGLRVPVKISKRNGNGSAHHAGSNGNAVSVEELRSFALKRLPEYMVPSAFVALEQLPLTPSGKTDRKALPDPSLHRPNLNTLYVTPDTEMERTIASLWQEVLKVDKVGIHDNFFDLGGYSLIMGKVRRKLELLLQNEISMVEMFEHPTVHSLASHLSLKATGASGGSSTSSLKPDYERAGRQQQAINRRRQQQRESRGNG